MSEPFLPSLDEHDTPATPAHTWTTMFGTPRPPVEAALFGSTPEAVTTDPRIAVIDDEPINIRVVTRYLEVAGYRQFFTTTDATQAIELIRSNRPDVLLLDIMMPHVSGLDILRELRADEVLADLPVIILTAAGDRATKLAALSLGATEFLTKPVDSVELETRLKNVLRVKSQQDRLKNYAWELELEVAVRTTELVQAHIEAVHCLAKAGEFRDNDTGKHVARVGRYAEIIARRLGMPEEFTERIRHAAPLHDIGKVGVPDSILRKPGRLDEEEMHIMRRHAALGRDLCESIGQDARAGALSHTVRGAQIVASAGSPVLRMAGVIAYTHHEKWDGSGYPRGLAAEDIPVEGRIAAVADVFDALCSARPYKPAYPVEDAVEIIRAGRAKDFDPRVVDVFIEGLEEILAVRRELADDPGA